MCIFYFIFFFFFLHARLHSTFTLSVLSYSGKVKNLKAHKYLHLRSDRPILKTHTHTHTHTDRLTQRHRLLFVILTPGSQQSHRSRCKIPRLAHRFTFCLLVKPLIRQQVQPPLSEIFLSTELLAYLIECCRTRQTIN